MLKLGYLLEMGIFWETEYLRFTMHFFLAMLKRSPPGTLITCLLYLAQHAQDLIFNTEPFDG